MHEDIVLGKAGCERGSAVLAMLFEDTHFELEIVQDVSNDVDCQSPSLETGTPL